MRSREELSPLVADNQVALDALEQLQRHAFTYGQCGGNFVYTEVIRDMMLCLHEVSGLSYETMREICTDACAEGSNDDTARNRDGSSDVGIVDSVRNGEGDNFSA